MGRAFNSLRGMCVIAAVDFGMKRSFAVASSACIWGIIWISGLFAFGTIRKVAQNRALVQRRSAKGCAPVGIRDTALQAALSGHGAKELGGT